MSDGGAPWTRDALEVGRAFDADPRRGLRSEDARHRLAQHGPNELRPARPVPVWHKLLKQFHEPLVYLLLGAIGISIVAWVIEGHEIIPVDAIVISVIVLVNAIIGYVQERKAENAVAALARITAVTSSVVRGGRIERIPSADIVPGELLLLAEGDSVGADARLIETASLRVQEASLTGESAPVLKDPATLPEHVALADRVNMVFKGTAVTQGTGRAIVTATGMNTEMGHIAELLETTKEEPTPLQKEVSRIGRMIGMVVIGIATIVMATVWALSDVRGTGDVIAILLLGVSLAVAAVPEGLPAILSVVLALGVQRLARRNAIVKKLSSVETLGSASVICSDKTGTLTRSEMTISRVTTASGTARVSGVGYVPKGSFEPNARSGGPQDAMAEQVVLLSGGSLASDAELRETSDGRWEIQGDPTEAAFFVAERKLGVDERRQRRFERVRAIPFTSERKMMSVIVIDHEHGDARLLVTKGAPDVLLARCARVRTGVDTIELDEAMRGRILADVETFAADALRTLSVAYRPLRAGEEDGSDERLERDLVFAGTVGMIDPPREEAAVAVREAHRAGIRVVMITGDHPSTASRIAQDLGIIEPHQRPLSGLDLDGLDDDAFAEAVRGTSVYARVAPQHKMRIVDALQTDRHIVAMTGDGVNDAPALKSADIGIAMGITGTEVTKQSAKMILADDNFATIVAAVREGRGIFDNIRKFLRYLLSSNMGEVLAVFLGVLFAGLIGLSGADGAVALPLLATQILWINLITDSAPALALGVDPQTEDVMARKPRQPTERVIDGRMWAGVVAIGAVMALLTLFTLDLYLPGGFIEGSRDLDNARTAAFTVLVMAQLFNCFNARSELVSAFDHLFVNAWLWAAIAVSVLLQIAVVHISFLNVAFGTAPLDFGQWVACVLIASVVLWASELQKWLLKAADRQ